VSKRVLAAFALAVVLAVSAGAANSASAKVAVSQGVSSSLLQGAKGSAPSPVFPIDDTTDPSTPEQVSFILRVRNQTLLQAQASVGQHARFLTTGQFAQLYGQTTDNIGSLQAYLAHFGITTTVMADRLDVQASGTAGEFNNALSTHQRDYQIPAVPARRGHPAIPSRRFHATQSSPLLPRQLASFVLAILGLSNYPTWSSDAVRAPQDQGARATAAALQLGDRTPADFASDYKLPHGDGHGSTIGIVTLAALDEPATLTFWNDILKINTLPNRITIDNVDGGPGAVSDAAGSGETTLDVEQSGALAPQAKVIVYQAPNTDRAFLDAFFQAASDNLADSVSASWGEAETVVKWAIRTGIEDPNFQQTFDEAFLEMAVQGQSAFVSVGDSGAYDDAAELGTTNLDVDSAGDSPWVTGSGGTTLPGTVPLPIVDTSTGNVIGTDLIPIAHERAWGWDYLWPHFADLCILFPANGIDLPCTEANWAKIFGIGGAGGGFSALEQMPFYQRLVGAGPFDAVQYLTPISPADIGGGLVLPTDWSFNPAPSVQTGSGNGRGEPDLSTDADPETGYEEFFSFNDQPPTLETGWGGTSFVAPQLNGSTAVIVSNLGHRVGFWNPQVYAFAASRNSPFTTLDSAGTNNDNLFYTGTPHRLWNPATGLGTPDLTAIQNDFAGSR
jgi:subtilase family serine protease